MYRKFNLTGLRTRREQRLQITSRIMLLHYTTHLAAVSYPNIDLETPMKAVPERDSLAKGYRGSANGHVTASASASLRCHASGHITGGRQANLKSSSLQFLLHDLSPLGLFIVTVHDEQKLKTTLRFHSLQCVVSSPTATTSSRRYVAGVFSRKARLNARYGF